MKQSIMNPEQKISIQANKLLGEYIGMLQGICLWDIPPKLKKKLQAKIEELDKVIITSTIDKIE